MSASHQFVAIGEATRSVIAELDCPDRPPGAHLLLQIIAEREERASIAIDLPFSLRGTAFLDPRLAAAIVGQIRTTLASSRPAPSPTSYGPARPPATDADAADQLTLAAR